MKAFPHSTLVVARERQRCRLMSNDTISRNDTSYTSNRAYTTCAKRAKTKRSCQSAPHLHRATLIPPHPYLHPTHSHTAPHRLSFSSGYPLSCLVNHCDRSLDIRTSEAPLLSHTQRPALHIPQVTGHFLRTRFFQHFPLVFFLAHFLSRQRPASSSHGLPFMLL